MRSVWAGGWGLGGAQPNLTQLISMNEALMVNAILLSIILLTMKTQNVIRPAGFKRQNVIHSQCICKEPWVYYDMGPQ